jgi:hypothetical protein
MVQKKKKDFGTKVISMGALLAIIERYKLKPVGGQYHITREMAAEAAEIDAANGVVPPRWVEEITAAAFGEMKTRH